MGDADGFPIVAIGASAGGLDASRKFLDALPVPNGMAFILVQHLDPTHDSMLVDLLANHTAMAVSQAVDGMALAPDHLYIIAPGTYLSVGGGALRVTQPQARHGARMPFDFLLSGMAEEYGARAVGVVLSGTGADGTLGLVALKDKGGLVIAQDPAEAGFDGMPRSAIATGAVDLVLPVARIPDALADHGRGTPRPLDPNGAPTGDEAPKWLPDVIDLLRAKTTHDFRLYKSGTLWRRIERRMALAGIDAGDGARYLNVLRKDAGELDLLAKDLLINVTSFFRDPEVFDILAKAIIPDLIKDHDTDQPLRIWVAGCSTGEETYSLAMLFREAISAANVNIKLQLFASDIDADAVASARDGLYPKTIEAEVSAARLSRFFSREDNGYRILPDLRAAVVFTVQDLLADPPFSRIDLVSCRNLLIYLRPEAQTKVMSLFNFALREGGVLLLGSSETVAASDSRFEVIDKARRIYRHIGRGRPGDLMFSVSGGESNRLSARLGPSGAPSRQSALAELCQRLVMDTYAPAAILINRKHECLYSLGPTSRYLRVAPGHASHDLLAMVRPAVRTKLRSAIQRATKSGERIVVPGGRMTDGDDTALFSIAVQPVSGEAEPLLLVCFLDAPAPSRGQGRKPVPAEAPRVAELELEIQAVRIELQEAIHNLEFSSEEQKAINEEALSVQEEYQSTNEELLTSKEELQSLNEELTALNGQLQETLERQRTTSNDLQNILYSTDVATLFLDRELNIRFFTPAVKAIFSVIPGDIGRPIADITSLAAAGDLVADAEAVLSALDPREREIQTRNGAWFVRRILPYRIQGGAVEGVVVTFADITESKVASEALSAAVRLAESANIAKSRFLAAASHDLRQPLQSLALIQGLLSKAVQEEAGRKLVARFEETVVAMSGMLNTLLDINQIEAGAVQADIVPFPIDDLLGRLKAEFGYLAEAQGLGFHVVPCGLSVESDPRLIEQMIRNLLSNALKYTKAGKILLGCRRRQGGVSIEVWDTGVGIPEAELAAIFEEYHQLDNAARQRSRGLGLGLAIVQRLGHLLGHRVRVRSRMGRGSSFSIDIKHKVPPSGHSEGGQPVDGAAEITDVSRRAGAILVVEDDPDLRDLLEMLLESEGHRTTMAPDGVAALDIVARGAIRPDLILADYNLPNGVNGVQLSETLRQRLRRNVPTIILTGDISTETLRDIALHDCKPFNKPVKLHDLTQAVRRLLPAAPSAAGAAVPSHAPMIVVVDDDETVRDTMRAVLEADGHAVTDFATGEAFLEAYRPGGGEACLLIDAMLPGMTGLQVLARLGDGGHHPPVIMITGASDVSMAVAAMKAGAVDFIEKPFGLDDLLTAIDRAIDQSKDAGALAAWRQEASSHMAGLTAREKQILTLVLAGEPSKNIAADLGVSQRTVENHRASIMKKTGAKSLPALARLAVAAGDEG